MLLRHAAKSFARRSFATEATTASATAPAAPAKASSSGGSSFGQRLLAFTVGFAVAGGMGLYQLNEDVEKSTAEIQKSISSLKSDVIAQNAALAKRIEQLEKSQ